MLEYKHSFFSEGRGPFSSLRRRNCHLSTPEWLVQALTPGSVIYYEARLGGRETGLINVVGTTLHRACSSGVDCISNTFFEHGAL